MFGCNVKNGKLSASQIDRMERIAADCGGEFVYANLPEGPRSWFQTENLGEPFDRSFAERVQRKLAGAVLADNN